MQGDEGLAVVLDELLMAASLPNPTMRMPWAPSPSSPSGFPAQGAAGGGGGGGTSPLPFLRRICRIHWGANPCLVPFLCLLVLGRRDVLLERRVWEVVLLGVLRARPRHVEFGAPARLCGVDPATAGFGTSQIWIYF